MTADFDPRIPADLDASGRDLILLYADDRVYLSEVLEGLGLPNLAAVRERLTARRLISGSLPQTRTREEVLAQRAAERRRLVDEARRIDAKYAGEPIVWDGPLDTDEQIAAAAVAMQREVEAEARAARRFRRDRTPEEQAELGRRALDVLQRVPRVPPDPGDQMPDERSVVLRRADTMSGAPIFRGTRVTVSTLFDHLADGYSLAEILDSFPTLDRDDCATAIRQAARLLADQAPDETSE